MYLAAGKELNGADRYMCIKALAVGQISPQACVSKSRYIYYEDLIFAANSSGPGQPPAPRPRAGGPGG